jgi:DNA-binding transcriptional MerR regulator
MTIGTLSRRTGIPVKALRTYEDMGLLYTVGRSDRVRGSGADHEVTGSRGRITR